MVKYGHSAQLWEQWSSWPTSRSKAQQGCSGTSPSPLLGVRLGSLHGTLGLAWLCGGLTQYLKTLTQFSPASATKRCPKDEQARPAGLRSPADTRQMGDPCSGNKWTVRRCSSATRMLPSTSTQTPAGLPNWCPYLLLREQRSLRLLVKTLTSPHSSLTTKPPLGAGLT